jgi:flagellar basal body-associated protein FliL
MKTLTHYPLLVFIISFLTLWVAALIGRFTLRGKQKQDKDARDDFSIILAGALTLLGIIIGFSFSMATDRYDQRKSLEENEANAISTEYVRLDLLPALTANKAKPLLRTYLDKRLEFYTQNTDSQLQQTLNQTEQLQNQLWAAILPSPDSQPNAVIALTVSGMNDVLNSQSYAQAMYWNRIPISAWCLVLLIAIGCNLLVGYGSRSATSGSRLLPILPVLVATALTFIADLDAPRHGLIRVVPQNLLSLQSSLNPVAAHK